LKSSKQPRMRPWTLDLGKVLGLTENCMKFPLRV
jgi:hypothetical protein